MEAKDLKGLFGEVKTRMDGGVEHVRKELSNVRTGRASAALSGAEEPAYFFSITHCSGCWCLRAKSITCVTLVSAIS